MLFEFTFHLSHRSFQNRTMTEHLKPQLYQLRKKRSLWSCWHNSCWQKECFSQQSSTVGCEGADAPAQKLLSVRPGPNPSDGSADTGLFRTVSLPVDHTNPTHFHLTATLYQSWGMWRDTVGNLEGVIPCWQAIRKVLHPSDAPVEIPERCEGRHAHPDNEVIVHKPIVPLILLV